jgi:hypothetical protein
LTSGAKAVSAPGTTPSFLRVVGMISSQLGNAAGACSLEGLEAIRSGMERAAVLQASEGLPEGERRRGMLALDWSGSELGEDGLLVLRLDAYDRSNRDRVAVVHRRFWIRFNRRAMALELIAP